MVVVHGDAVTDGVEVVGINAASGTEGEHQGVVEEVLADHHIGEEAEDGTLARLRVGIPSGGEADMEVEAVKHEVGIGVDLHDIEVVFFSVVEWRCHHVAEGHIAVGIEGLDIAVPFGMEVSHTFVLIAKVEAIVDVAAEVEVELVTVPRGPEVGEVQVEAVAQLVGVELHIAETEVPGEKVVLGADVGKFDIIAVHTEGRQQGVVGEAVEEVMVVLIVEVGGKLQDILDDILAEECDAGEAKVVLAVVLGRVVTGNGTPGGAVVDADAVGLQRVARGGEVEVEQRTPVVADAEAEVVVV